MTAKYKLQLSTIGFSTIGIMAKHDEVAVLQILANDRVEESYNHYWLGGWEYDLLEKCVFRRWLSSSNGCAGYYRILNNGRGKC